MSRVAFVLLSLATACVPAHAAQRTFVATYGFDINAAQHCSLVAPCRTFSGAIGVTDPNGEVIVLNSGGYGTATILQSVSIISPPGIYAGVTVTSAGTGFGISINQPGISVTLRGLTINGQGGSRGIWFGAGARLRVENCVVANMTNFGIVAEAAGGELDVVDSVLRDNGQDGILFYDLLARIDRTRIEHNTLDGIAIAAASGHSTAVVSRSLIARNGGSGILAYSTGVTGVVDVELRDTVIADNNRGVWARPVYTALPSRIHASRVTISGNAGAGVTIDSSGNQSIFTLFDSEVSGNGGAGLTTAGSGPATIVVGGSTVARNASFGFKHTGASAVFLSRKDNALHANNGGGAQTSGTITALALE
jgi:hypothetical protein